ncbi:MAG TPA: glycosyltransferase family A protein [bacterium]|nr:glycosyltransferase family A protein [bacterium]
MKKFMVTDIRWASEGEFALPFWKDLNENKKLPIDSWGKAWAYPYLFSKIPSSAQVLDYADVRKREYKENAFLYLSSMFSLKNEFDLISELKEITRLVKHRFVVALGVGDQQALPIFRLYELEKFLGCRIPLLPFNALRSNSEIVAKHGQKCNEKERHIRILAFTIDAVENPRSVAILIPHWESYKFLKQSILHIRKYGNENIIEKIYVLDDQSKDGSFDRVQRDFANDQSIEFHTIVRENKNKDLDVTLLLDMALPLVHEQFVVMIDSDSIPVSRDWISFPIWLLERYKCSAVGCDTGLSQNYYYDADGIPLWQPQAGYPPSAGLYDNDWFVCINNFYRVMRSADAKVASEGIGFSRANNWRRRIDIFLRSAHNTIIRRSNPVVSSLYKRLSAISLFRKIINPRYPYLPRGCDNGVAANHFIDINRLGPKFNLPICSFLGLTPQDGVFGQNIAGLLFHFALSTRSSWQERRGDWKAGADFLKYHNILSDQMGEDDAPWEDMIKESFVLKSGGYNGEVPAKWYAEQYERIKTFIDLYKKEQL